MTLLNYRRDMGKLAVYDVSRHVHIHRIRPIIHTSSHTKHQHLHYNYDYDTNNIIPARHDINDNSELYRVVMLFLEATGIKRDAELIVSPRRIICPNNCNDRDISHDLDVNAKITGILCVSRHNISGGRDIFKQNNEMEKFLLQQGHLVVYDNTKVKHRTTKILAEDKTSPAWRDIIVLACACQGE